MFCFETVKYQTKQLMSSLITLPVIYEDLFHWALHTSNLFHEWGELHLRVAVLLQVLVFPASCLYSPAKCTTDIDL